MKLTRHQKAFVLYYWKAVSVSRQWSVCADTAIYALQLSSPLFCLYHIKYWVNAGWQQCVYALFKQRGLQQYRGNWLKHPCWWVYCVYSCYMWEQCEQPSKQSITTDAENKLPLASFIKIKWYFIDPSKKVSFFLLSPGRGIAEAICSDTKTALLEVRCLAQGHRSKGDVCQHRQNKTSLMHR